MALGLGHRVLKQTDEIEFQPLTSRETTNSDAGKLNNTDASRKSPYNDGWRFGVLNCALSVSLVFLVNLGLTISGFTIGSSGQDGVLVDGDCNKTHRLNTILHLVINVLSSIILSASNYSMQFLSAPTRKEVDLAHAKGLSLDIGIPSITNLKHISKKMVLLWFVLGASSLPLHLIYNSVLFSSITSNRYYIYGVEETFLTRDHVLPDNRTSIAAVTQQLWLETKEGKLEKLSNADCIKEYAQMFQTSRRHVLVILEPGQPRERPSVPNRNPDIWYLDFFDATDAQLPHVALNIYSWICPSRISPCGPNINKVKTHPEDWAISNGYKVSHCLSQAVEERCKLQFIPQVAIVVIILNFIKAVIILYTAFRVKESPLMTMGDVVASFLQNEDPTTRNACLLSMNDTKEHQGYFPAGPREWHGQTFQWKDVTTKKSRWIILALFTGTMILVAALLGAGINVMNGPRSLKALASLGLGTTNPQTIVSWEVRRAIPNIILANLPQLILSFLYFCYNRFFTSMLLGVEWSTYSHQRKGLRLSGFQRGEQRTSYFLQLPYRFALPLMLLSAILHWLVSQSIFLVAVDFYEVDDSFLWHFASCGYSPIAIIFVLVLCICMILAGIGVGYLKFKPGVNLVGSSSAAISAACHLSPEEGMDGRTVAARKLMWGAVKGDRGEVEGAGHCGFSAREVELPVKGTVYAGRGSGGGYAIEENTHIHSTYIRGRATGALMPCHRTCRRGRGSEPEEENL